MLGMTPGVLGEVVLHIHFMTLLRSTDKRARIIRVSLLSNLDLFMHLYCKVFGASIVSSIVHVLDDDFVKSAYFPSC